MAETSLETIHVSLEGLRRESKLSWDGLRRENAAQFVALEQRLAAIDTKQAAANSRTTKLEQQLVRMDERISVLQKADGDHDDRLTTVEGHVHHRKNDPAPAKRVHSRSDDGKFVTPHDVKVFALGGGAVWGLIKGGFWLLDQLKGAL